MSTSRTNGTSIYETHPQRVVFAPESTPEQLVAEMDRLATGRAMLVTGPSEKAMGERVTSAIDLVATYGEVRQHIPSANADAACEAARVSGADVLIAVGGGSTIGTAKVVALRLQLPIVAVPTTFAGSEATDVWGLTTDERKTNGSDPSVLPRVVLYDPELTLSLPPKLVVSSGLNALAHCIDALWGPTANVPSTGLAVEGIRQIAHALTTAHANSTDLGARLSLQTGCYVAASAFASSGSGLHHKICHVLGGAYGLEHSSMHAVLLPHVVGFNAPAAPMAAERIASALGSEGYGDGSSALEGLLALYEVLDAPDNLSELGLSAHDVPQAAALAHEKVPPTNPRTVSTSQLRRLLSSAQAGERASSVALEGATHTDSGELE